MHVTPSFDDHERARALDTIVQLARLDVPEIATLTAVARMSDDDDVATQMLERSYVIALDGPHEYLAELLDGALADMEHDPTP